MKKKLIKIIWPLIYLVLIINVCLSFILVFRSYYFRSIFVSGPSMEPTLHGDKTLNNGYVDYGIIDDHKYTIGSLKRFQIITTYYPFSGSSDYVGGYKRGEKNVISSEASYKIKRVYGFPGETIRFDINADLVPELSVLDPNSEQFQDVLRRTITFSIKEKGGSSFVEQKISFKRKIRINEINHYANYEYELGENEYWVMGDNYGNSDDCFRQKAPIYYDNIVGVLIAIQGSCKIDPRSDTTEDGTKTYYECTKRKRRIPTYYY